MTVHLEPSGTSDPASSLSSSTPARSGAIRFLPLAATGYVVAALVGNGLAGGETDVRELAGTPAYTAGIALEALGPVWERTVVGAASLLLIWTILLWMHRRRIFLRI